MRCALFLARQEAALSRLIAGLAAERAEMVMGFTVLLPVAAGASAPQPSDDAPAGGVDVSKMTPVPENAQSGGAGSTNDVQGRAAGLPSVDSAAPDASAGAIPAPTSASHVLPRPDEAPPQVAPAPQPGDVPITPAPVSVPSDIAPPPGDNDDVDVQGSGEPSQGDGNDYSD